MGNLFSSKEPVYKYDNTYYTETNRRSQYQSSTNRSAYTSTSAVVYPYRTNSDVHSNLYSSPSNQASRNINYPLSEVSIVKKSVTKISNDRLKLYQVILYQYIINQSQLYLSWNLLSTTNYQLYNLEKESSEFNDIFTKFYKGVLGEIYLIKIERVENPYLLSQYCMKRLEYVNKYLSVQEKLLFHGTKQQYVSSICTNNFDWRFYGQTKGNLFGKGVSFTPNSSYANHYCDRKGTKVMIVAKVLVCNTCEGNENMTIPSYLNRNRFMRYDTAVKLPKKDVYVKFSDDEFYPAYLIHYSGKMFYPNKGFYR